MDEVAEVKSRLEITEVVGGYLPLKQAGAQPEGAVPVSSGEIGELYGQPGEGHLSLLWLRRGRGYFQFRDEDGGLGFSRGAGDVGAQGRGGAEGEKGREQGAANRLRDRLYSAHELAVKYFQASLVQNPKALEYVVKKRRLNKETIKAFGIGYAPDSWNALRIFW
jgi:DNA primase